MTQGILTGYRLSPHQRSLWPLLRRYGSALRATTVIRMEGGVDPARLGRAIDSLTRRHDILRTRFRSVDGLAYPLQVVREDAPVLRQVDLGQSVLEQPEAIGALL